MTDQHPAIRRNEMIRDGLLAAFAIALIGAVLLSPRPLWPTNRPNIAPVRLIPLKGELERFGDWIDAYGIIMPKAEHLPIIAAADPRLAEAAAPDPQPRLGYSYREIALLGLPLMAYPEFGYVAYREHQGFHHVVPLDADALALLDRKAGARLEQGWWFPVWRCWGLLYVAALIGIGLFELRAQRRRREVLGIY